MERVVLKKFYNLYLLLRQQALLLTLLIFVLLQSCKSPTAPKSNNSSDTTSHNWVFTIDTLGEGNGSTLHDVAIVSISPFLVYAVGEIYLKDSTGQFDQQPYNLAKWDGNEWKLQKLIAGNFPPVIKSVFVVNDHNVWFDPWFHWDGQNFHEIPSDPIFYGIGIDKMWGNSNGLYVVGTGGFIAFMNTSGTWQKLSSGTSTDIQDIWGYQNTSGQTTILCVSSSVFYGGEESLFSISGNNVNQLNTNGLSWSERGLWFDDKGYYIVGDGMYYKKTLQDTVWQSFQKGLTTYYIEAIRGNAPNDIVAVGDYGAFLHYNGSSWFDFTQQLNLPNCVLNSVSIKDNLVVAVGTLGGDRGIIVVGKRQ